MKNCEREDMCRDIKFRAWDKAIGEYLSVGNLFISVNPFMNPKESNIYLDTIENPNRYNNRFVIEQFTGLYDTNGTEIYEGDIVDGIMKDDNGKETDFRNSLGVNMADTRLMYILD